MDTPRTDALYRETKYNKASHAVVRAFALAGDLEIELAQATARAESAERELATLRQVKAGQQAEPVVLGGGSGPFPVRGIGPAPDGWVLRRSDVNELQADSINRLIARAKHAHYTDVRLRINGEYELYEADWIKHLAAAPAAPESK